MSFGATVLGALLLMADGDDSCETYGGYRGSFTYETACPGVPATGSVSFSWGESEEEQPAARAATAQLGEGGFSVSGAAVDYTGSCYGNEGQGEPEDVRFWFGGVDGKDYYCSSLHLHVSGPLSVGCAPNPEVGGGMTPTESCSITFTKVP